MGYEVFVFNKYGHEIDFLAQKDGKEYLIQAAYSIAEEKTYQREFALFNTLDQSRRKIMITTDEFDYSTSTVRHASLFKKLGYPPSSYTIKLWYKEYKQNGDLHKSFK